ncbi:hypothetical protein FisN_10Lh300 [Fistulifera solaris]|uniref:GC-rich sequence DNA-binding factor n=1 Tax=Fistulifera solaris TaxID=1519565 RepID=A0A1Z5KFK4_FISSO|nr:hypothetical protein FisN_10Lh300 [Fistulifera solaris]|eukprot:GAX25100.1 hypothetical protein FisN_10Lh300 [Fistulifera solaris]
MFRKPIKPKNTIQNRLTRSLENDDDDKDDETVIRHIQKRNRTQNKRRRTLVRKVRVTKDDDNEPEDFTSSLFPVKAQTSSSSSLYSKDAMAQLKAEQNFYHRPEEESTTAVPLQPTKEEEQQQQFISLQEPNESSSSNTRILTGEEAFFLENSNEDTNDVEMDGDFNVDSTDVQDWEKEVARRAGISIMPPSTVSPTHPSLQNLQDNITHAIRQIRAQQENVLQARERREQQVQLLEEDLRRSRKELERSGAAFEYFQRLRQKLAMWIGAMRELQTKVRPIQDALYQLQADVAALERWHDLEDDMTYYLKKQGRLMKVLGRQPAEPLADLPHVDEFGRNVQSQQSLQREKRMRHLQMIAEERQQIPRGDELDSLLSDNEQEEFRERHSALQEALSVALVSLDEKFTKLQWLVDDFAVWKKDYAAEYKQCYAGLSLADLASVLVRAELCELNDPWNESEGYNEAKWTTVIRSAQALGLLDEIAIERLLDKSVLPAVQSVLSKNGFNICSTKDVKTMSTFLRHVEPFLSPQSAVAAALKTSFVDYIRMVLARIAIPIPSSIAQKQVASESQMDANAENMALQYATIGQLYRIKTILTNVVTLWPPLLQIDHLFGEYVLDFIGNKFLLLLSATTPFEQPRFSASPTDMFTEVWNALQPTGWLNDPNLLVASATIRAAAMAYGLT